MTFNANEGTVTPAEKTVTYGSTYEGTATPTRKGYTFVGWYTEQNGGTKVMADTVVTTAEASTLYAHWTQNIYTVTIKADKDGDVIETQQIPEGGMAKKPPKSRCARLRSSAGRRTARRGILTRTPSSARRKSSRCGKRSFSRRRWRLRAARRSSSARRRKTRW
ncbi:MAG: InlB B-repeat-containing protein [Christensenellales bacterium]